MNKKSLLLTLAACTASLMSFSAAGYDLGSSEVIAKYTSEPVTLDGKLDEGDWAKAPAYSLCLPFKAYSNAPESIQKNIGDKLQEQCKVKLLWDDNYLYVGGVFEDSDVMQEGKEDQSHLYNTGDLLEVFLKPANGNCYWEIYGTPNNKKTWFFFPSRGRIVFPACGNNKPESFKVAATVDGTLNNWKDKDKSWTIEMAIPIKELTAYGAKFDNSANWTILLARYNYSVYLQKQELTAFPQLSNVSWHIYEEYARLRLEK
ncbi:MAG: carbohydrate-binding family 9-like protein [Lentisphaerota bacterium]